MKCRAALWYSMPCAVPDIRTYPSRKAVRQDMESMVEDWMRFGGAEPVGAIYDYHSDEQTHYLTVSPHGTIHQNPV